MRGHDVQDHDLLRVLHLGGVPYTWVNVLGRLVDQDVIMAAVGVALNAEEYFCLRTASLCPTPWPLVHGKPSWSCLGSSLVPPSTEILCQESVSKLLDSLLHRGL